MNKTLSFFAAALMTVAAMSGPVLAAQSGDHIKQHDPVYWNPELRDNDTLGRVSTSDLRNETQKPASDRAFMPN